MTIDISEITANLQGLTMSLPGPSRTIIVEPLEDPSYQPRELPNDPDEEPIDVPDYPPVPEEEPVPA